MHYDSPLEVCSTYSVDVLVSQAGEGKGQQVGRGWDSKFFDLEMRCKGIKLKRKERCLGQKEREERGRRPNLCQGKGDEVETGTS